MAESFLCPECGTERREWGRVCPACGAPPYSEHRSDGEGGVRTTDLEPYVALGYIARLFKVLAVLIVLMLVGEVVTGIMIDGRAALMTLLGEGTRLMVMAGLLWAGGDIVLLLIDAGHDLRVVRILLGRVNAHLHHGGSPEPEQRPAPRPPSAPGPSSPA